MRVVLLGTGPFAVPSFEAVRAGGYDEIALVVTRPTMLDSKGRANPNPVRQWAESHGLEVAAPSSINEPSSIDLLRTSVPELLIVCDYGQILSAEAIATARFGGINLHGSLLPRHRGAAPVQWSVLTGEATTGACVIHLTPKLDAGPVLTRVETAIGTHENAGELELRLSELGVACTLEALAMIRECDSIERIASRGTLQDPALATKAPRLKKSDGQLDFRYPASIVDRQIRGLQPWPGAYGILELDNAKELRVAIGRAWSTNGESTRDGSTNEVPSEPGRLIWGAAAAASGSGAELLVECGEGRLAVETLQPAGKRMMKSKEFLAGYGKQSRMQFRHPEAPSHPLLEKLTKG